MIAESSSVTSSPRAVGRRTRAAAALLAACLGVAACSGDDATGDATGDAIGEATGEATGDAASPRPDVLLIVVDTLRADRCSLYGHDAQTTPHLDALGARGVVFDVAYAPVPTTSPSHATLFTGRLPSAHGLVRNGLPLLEDELTLAERLAAAGWTTAAFVSSFPVSARFGFAQGFDVFDDGFARTGASFRRRTWQEHELPASRGFDRSPERTTRAALAWLETADAAEPVFLWVHHFDPHGPREPPPRYRGIFPPRGHDEEARERSRYDAEVRYVDDEIGKLLEAFLARPHERGAFVIVTSDHGEGLWDHGWRGHDRSVYEEEVRVPLVLAWEGVLPEGRRVAHPAQLADVVPTVLDALGLGPLAGDDLDGQSLWPHALGRAAPDPERALLLARPYFPGGREDYGEVGVGVGVRRGRWKYFEAPEERRAELYDLDADADERVNVVDEHREVAAALAEHVRRWVDAGWRDAEQVDPLDADARAALEALGYVGGDEAADGDLGPDR